MAEISIATLDVRTLQKGSVEALGRLLDPQESQRVQAFRFEQDRTAYCAAHGLQRLLVAAVIGGDPAAVQVVPGAPGTKPQVTVPGCHQRFDVSLSHARGAVACAVGLGCQVGIDVEVDDRSVGEDLVAEVFTAEERRWLGNDLALAAAEGRIMMVWTLKEAVSKALGLGLSLGFSDLSLRHGSAENTYNVWTVERWPAKHRPVSSQSWQLRTWSPHSGVRAAVAVGLDRGEELHQIVPEGRGLPPVQSVTRLFP